MPPVRNPLLTRTSSRCGSAPADRVLDQSVEGRDVRRIWMPHDDAALCPERLDHRLLEDGRERLDERVAAIGERVPVREIEGLEVEQLVDDRRRRPTSQDGSVNGLRI